MVNITPRPLYFRQELWYPLNSGLFGTQSPLTSLILQVNIETETVSLGDESLMVPLLSPEMKEY